MLLLQLLWHLLVGQQESALLQSPVHGFHGCHGGCFSVLRLLLLLHVPHPKAGAVTGSRLLLHRGGSTTHPQCLLPGALIGPGTCVSSNTRTAADRNNIEALAG